MHRLVFVIGILCVGPLGSLSHAIEPANPDLIPEARAVLDYLASLEGNGTLGGDHIIIVDFKSRYNLDARIEAAAAVGQDDVAHRLAGASRT